jgi:hypothetical protein
VERRACDGAVVAVGNGIVVTLAATKRTEVCIGVIDMSSVRAGYDRAASRSIGRCLVAAVTRIALRNVWKRAAPCGADNACAGRIVAVGGRTSDAGGIGAAVIHIKRDVFHLVYVLCLVGYCRAVGCGCVMTE